MKIINIKYNPYRMRTEINISDVDLPLNSRLRAITEDENRLQSWIENLPEILTSEFNESKFTINFFGTRMDYEDLKYVFEKSNLNVNFNFKETDNNISDKIKKLDNVFKDIQNGPIEDLKTQDITSAFERARTDEFEVSVVAKMSAGKSTFINALLGKKLMPSKTEACTAIITQIKDNDEPSYSAEILNDKGELLTKVTDLSLKQMIDFNENKNVSGIKIEGDVPFLKSTENSLVLVDTPGPNNARNKDHLIVQQKFLSESSKALVLFIMNGDFGTNDEDQLLSSIAKSMQVNGKQSKDRFIFIVNKLDDLKAEDGDLDSFLNKIKNYLKKYGIIDPLIFPVSALTALNIRTIANGSETDEDTIDDTVTAIRKFNRNEKRHFEKYVNLPMSLQNNIRKQIDILKNGKDNVENINNSDLALIHSGIPSVEQYIEQYIEKYANTAKIKNIVDTFEQKVRGEIEFEGTKKTLLSKLQEDTDDSNARLQKIRQKIEKINEELANKDKLKEFKSRLKVKKEEVVKRSGNVIYNTFEEIQSEITMELEDIDKYEQIDVEKAKAIENKLKHLAERLKNKFNTNINELVTKNLKETQKKLLAEYKERLNNLLSDDEKNDETSVKINPLKMMSGSIDQIINSSLDNKIQEKEEVIDVEHVDSGRRWYNPLTWFNGESYDREIKETKQYVYGEDLMDMFNPFQSQLVEAAQEAEKYVERESNKILEGFQSKTDKLDEELKKKLNSLKSYATDEKKAEQRVKETNRKQAWLEQIESKINKILDI